MGEGDDHSCGGGDAYIAGKQQGFPCSGGISVHGMIGPKGQRAREGEMKKCLSIYCWKKRRNAGYFQDSGKGWMADDFDEPLSDFQEYMG